MTHTESQASFTNRAVVFGADGGIGVATCESLLKLECVVHPVYRCNIDLNSPNAEKQIHEYLDRCNPTHVINCAGVFGDNDSNFETMFNVNVRSNWAIIDYYRKNPEKSVDIVLVGSTAYDHGRQNYMLYSASKSALHNLWEGAKDFFSNTNILIHIVHPARTRTKMVAPFDDKLDYLEPVEVAHAVLEKCFVASTSSSKTLTLGNKNENRFIG